MPINEGMNRNWSPAESFTNARRKAYRQGARELIDSCLKANIPPDLVSARQGAAVAGVTVTWIRKRIREGSLKTWMVGTRRVFSLRDLVKESEPEQLKASRQVNAEWKSEWRRQWVRKVKPQR